MYADHMYADHIEDAVLAEAEAEAMQRPSNSAMWDDRLYTTHAPVMSWAELGDDLVAESNYLCALKILEAANREGEDDVIDASIHDWLVNRLRQIFVRVRDETGEFTPAWLEAVGIALFLRQGNPVLDDDDLSERESEAFEEELDDAIKHVEFHGEDADALDQQLRELTAERYREQSGWNEVDWKQVSAIYERVRDEHYEKLADEYLPYEHVESVPIDKEQLPQI
jgi:hypothetical protein